MTALQAKNIVHKILCGEKCYPARLNDFYDPQSCLYVSGNIEPLNQPMIAIVGSRRASIHGLRSAHLFARFLARAGAVVVSGLARGIDGVAHAGALATDLGL